MFLGFLLDICGGEGREREREEVPSQLELLGSSEIV
jgi:hypothetical protein